MGVFFRKDQSLCGTCAYWGGAKEISGDAVQVDPTGYGKCEHPDNFPIDQRMATENACPKFVLYAALN